MNHSVEFGQEMQEPQRSVIHIKWNHFGILRRFQLNEHEWKFSKLLEKIRMVEPLFSGCLGYSDEDGDKIIFSSTTEMDEMLAHFRQLRVSTIKIESIDIPHADQHGPVQAAQEAQKILHPNIICDLCDSPVRGIRYKCATCDDYDLCEGCEKTGAHKEHAMIRLVTPDPTKLYELLYSLRRRENRGRHGEHRWPRHGGPPFNKDVFVNKMRERTDRLQKLHESMVRNNATPQNPGVVHQNSVASGNISTSTPKPNTTPTVLHRHPELDQGLGSGSSQSNPQPNVGINAQRPPIVDHFQQKMDYLKNIGAQVQQALLHFGIECEATVEDDNGRVRGRVPLARAASQSQAQASNSNQAPKRKSEDRTAAEESKLPKKTETSHIAAQTIADQTTRESLSQAIQTATHETINRASQASLEALNTATEIMGSLGLSEQIGQTTNRRGADVLETVKTSVENLANAMTPLIADLTEKCQIGGAIPMPPPPNMPQQQGEAPQQNSTPQPNPQEHVSENSQNNVQENRNQVGEFIAMDTTEEIIHIDNDEESCHTAVELDSDVEVLNEVVNMPDVEQSCPHPVVEENNGHNGTPNNSNNISSGTSEAGCDSYQIDSDEEWMLVSKSSYKQLCDFYEKQRKAKEGENVDDLEEIFGGPSGQQKEMLQAALSRATSTLSRDTQEIESTQIVNVTPQPEQVPTSLVQASQAAATTLNQCSNSGAKSAIYPELVEDIKCCAGMPYYNPVKPHNKRCYVRHTNPIIDRAVTQLENMGYDNCNGWLTRLAEMHNGNIEKILDSAIEDPLYLARMAD